MNFHKGYQIEKFFRYFLYLTKEPIRHLNVKVPAFMNVARCFIMLKPTKNIWKIKRYLTLLLYSSDSE